MTSVVVDPATLVRLTHVGHTVELTDAAGHVVGHFIPAIDPQTRQAMMPDISEEELRRREQQGGGRPLKDILRDLEKRT
jgi:hypothetical protein